MSLEKIRAIIIKTLDYKEKDRLVYLYTENLGKISCIAKNVRSKSSKYASILQPLNICDFVLFKGKSLHIINEVTAVNTFPSIKNDYDRLMYAMYFAELIDISQDDESISPDYFMDVIKAMYLLENEAIDISKLVRAFELKTLEKSGNYPDFSYLENTVSGEGRGIMKFFLSNQLEKLNILKASEKAMKEVENVNKELIREGFHRIPKSLSVINGEY